MSDNSVLNPGSGGDTVRDLARQSGTIKTQVVQLDLGGATANAEVLITAGQQTVAASVPVISAVPASIYSAQQTLTTSAAPLTAQALVNGVIIKALPANTGTVYVGPSGVTTSTGYPLLAGEAISYAVQNANAVYIIGTNTSDIVAVTGN